MNSSLGHLLQSFTLALCSERFSVIDALAAGNVKENICLQHREQNARNFGEIGKKKKKSITLSHHLDARNILLGWKNLKEILSKCEVDACHVFRISLKLSGSFVKIIKETQKLVYYLLT